METKYLRINPADNVAVAIVNLPAGEYLSVDGIEITLNEDIPAGHKFALKNFSEGENVIKYGYPIAVSYTHLLAGLASGDIASMAYNMQIAFATTVVGLVAGAVGFLTQQVKQRWYLQDMTNLEFIAELLNENRTTKTTEK